MAGKRIMITLSEKALNMLEQLSEERQMSKSVLITLAIEEMKEKEEKRAEKNAEK